MLTHKQMIEQWPPLNGRMYDQIAADLGVRSGLIAVWRHRGKIPPNHWFDLVQSAARRGLSGIDLESLSRGYDV